MSEILIIDQEKVKVSATYLSNSLEYYQNAIIDLKDALDYLGDDPDFTTPVQGLLNRVKTAKTAAEAMIDELNQAYKKSKEFNKDNYKISNVKSISINIAEAGKRCYKYEKKQPTDSGSSKDETSTGDKPKTPKNKPKTPKDKPKDKKLTKVVNAVIAGKYGNGAEREKALRKAGYTKSQIKKIQDKVNKILKNKKDSKTAANKATTTKSKTPKLVAGTTIATGTATVAKSTPTTTKTTSSTGAKKSKKTKSVTKADLTKKVKKQQKAIKELKQKNKTMNKDLKKATAASAASATAYKKQVDDIQKNTQAEINAMEKKYENTISSIEQKRATQVSDLKQELTNIETAKQQEINSLNEKIGTLEQEKNNLINQNNASNNSAPVQNYSNQQSQNSSANYETEPAPLEPSESVTEPVVEPVPDKTTTPDLSEEVKEEKEPIIIEEPKTTTPKKSGGSSAIPIGLGVAAAGAATVAGARYIKNRNNSDNEYDDYDDEGSSSDYTDNSSDTSYKESTGPVEKYRAGSVNKLVLDNSDDDIKIEDDDYESSFDEELE